MAEQRDAADSEAVRKVIIDTMSDHFGYPDSGCAHPNPATAEVRRYKTMMNSLIDLTAGEYRVLAGNPCQGEHRLVPWDLYDGPGAAA